MQLFDFFIITSRQGEDFLERLHINWGLGSGCCGGRGDDRRCAFLDDLTRRPRFPGARST